MIASQLPHRWSARAALAAIILGSGAIGGGYFVVVYGLDHNWSRLWRGLAFVAAAEGVGLLSAGLHRFFGIGTWVTEQGRSFERFAVSMPLAFMGAIGIPMWLASVLGMAPARAMFATIGAGSLGMAIWRPWWFWYSPEVAALRALITDVGVRALYLIVGATCVGLAIFSAQLNR